MVAELPPPAPPSTTSKALNPPQIHMSPNGAFMAVKYYTDFDLWDTRRAQKIGTLTNTSLIAFSPDGKTLAITGNNEVVGFFDLQTIREVNVIDGGIGRIDLLVFSADGRRIAIASGRMLRCPGPALNRQLVVLELLFAAFDQKESLMPPTVEELVTACFDELKISQTLSSIYPAG